MNDALRELLDKQEIIELLHRYSRGVDRCNVALVRSVYHEDSYDDHGYWKGPGRAFADFICERLRAANSSTLHSVTNVIVELDEGEARCESHVHASLVRREGVPPTVDFFAGRYLDQFTKRDGHWGISHRTVVMDWVRSDTVGAGAGWPYDTAPFVKGDRSPSDPSDTLFGA